MKTNAHGTKCVTFQDDVKVDNSLLIHRNSSLSSWSDSSLSWKVSDILMSTTFINEKRKKVDHVPHRNNLITFRGCGTSKLNLLPKKDKSALAATIDENENHCEFIHNNFDEGYEVGLMYQPSVTTYPTNQRSLELIHKMKSQLFRRKRLINLKLYSVNKLGKVERLKLLDTADPRKCDEDSTGSPAGVDCCPSSIGQDNSVAPTDALLLAPGVRTLEEKLFNQTFIDSESLYSVDLLRIPYDDSSLVESVELEPLGDLNDLPPFQWSSYQCFDVFDLADRIDDCCMDDGHVLETSNSFDDSDVVVSAEEAEYRKLLRRKLVQKRRKERMMRKIKNQETNTIVRDDSFYIVYHLPD